MSNRKNEFNCLMLYFDFPQIKSVHNLIDEEDIYEDPEDDSFGLEKEPHVTLLFGLHEEVTLEQVKEIIDKYEFDEVTIKNPSMFDSEKYDVFKYEAESPVLKKCNKELSKLPNTNEYDYHPHMTIAYLKKGKAKKYIKDLKHQIYKLKPKYAVYSLTDGSKTNIKLNN